MILSIVGFKRGNTIVVVLLIPTRITRHILRRLMMLLLSAVVEHLLEELELGVCACNEEDGCGEGDEESSHFEMSDKRRVPPNQRIGLGQPFKSKMLRRTRS